MIPSLSLRFMDDQPAAVEADAEAERPEAAEPKVFVRTISTPPGLPWEQGRVADLEARHGSPLPIGEVLYRVRRLEGWRPGSPGRFAAFYVLAGEVDGRLDASAEVDGQTLTVTFVTGGARVAEAGLAVARTGLIAALAALLIAGVAAALNRRAETAAALQVVELRAEAKLKRAEAARRGGDLDRLLGLELERGVRLRDALGDLAWASNAKAPDARIEALHWEPGLLAVTVKGEGSPFQAVTDREIRRADRPVRPGTWLWGVTEPPPQAAGAPVAAEVRP